MKTAVTLALLVASALACSRSKDPTTASPRGCVAGAPCSPGDTSCTGPIGTGWSHALMCQGGTWTELEIAPLPTPVPTASASAVAAERVWEARKDGQLVLRISDRPGPLVDTNAPPPPPGPPPPSNAFLSASCSGSPMVCSRAGDLLRSSRSLDELLARLKTDGFEVKQLP